MVRVGGRIVFVAWGLRLASIFTISVSADASLNLLNGAPSTSAVTDFCHITYSRTRASPARAYRSASGFAFKEVPSPSKVGGARSAASSLVQDFH
jgi:hypothetical protein